MNARTERNRRVGMSIVELTERFPDEKAARAWLEGIKWADGKPDCPYCGSLNIAVVKNEKPQPYRCRDCRKHFSLKTGTVMADSNLPLRKWVYAIYLMTTSLKGVSSMKLHRDLGISQKTAWLLAQKIREAFADDKGKLEGVIEIDETYIGGRNYNRHKSKRIKNAKGIMGKAPVIGMVERGGRVKAKHIIRTDSRTMQGYIGRNAEYGSFLITDDHHSYRGIHRSYRHRVIKHSAKQYVDGMVHTNGIESFWALLKRGVNGTYHHISVKHLNRYVSEFAARHNVRTKATLDQMTEIAKGFIGKRLTYKELTR